MLKSLVGFTRGNFLCTSGETPLQDMSPTCEWRVVCRNSCCSDHEYRHRCNAKPSKLPDHPSVEGGSDLPHNMFFANQSKSITVRFSLILSCFLFLNIDDNISAELNQDAVVVDLVVVVVAAAAAMLM